ncbi:MAG TPA: hypothetical protein VGO55_03645 [Allosphingosinicella sp.]|nr:hypothetical protein [Allosphingosinicella sp.]
MRTALAAAACLAWPTALSAQESDARTDRLERQIDRVATQTRAEEETERAGLESLAPQPVSKLNFIVLLPVSWTNNAGYAEDDGETAVHATPSFEMRASRTSPGLRLEARATIASDNYSRVEDNNLSFLRFRFEIGGVEPGPLNFVPYARYQPVVEFSDAHLGDYSKTKHDFSIGGVNSFKVGDAGGTVRLFVTRRESTDPNAERFQLGGQVALEGPLAAASHWGWSATQGLEARFFTGGTNDGRTDIYVSTNGTISWRPTPESSWTFNALDVTVEWNRSDVADRDYFVVNAGSSISFRF